VWLLYVKKQTAFFLILRSFENKLNLQQLVGLTVTNFSGLVTSGLGQMWPAGSLLTTITYMIPALMLVVY